LPDQQGHELGVGDEVQYFLDDFTVCDVTILCIEADGNYLVVRPCQVVDSAGGWSADSGVVAVMVVAV